MKTGECLFVKATKNKYDDYYSIRSEEKNLFWTGYEKAPHYENFKKWYAERLSDPARDIYLMYFNEKCVGSLHIDFHDDSIAIGYSVKESFEGKGFGTLLVKESVRLAKLSKKQGRKIGLIRAWINFQNIGSIKVIEKNGFQQSEISEVRKRFNKEEVYFEYTLKI
ncbi:MAG: GNAT family N-acetyltransferase [Bacteroidales bacterium]|nr:GNAT family N-acetyltransferase [Bacteroidales bacterium]MCF8405479.1 GNAT family N-acetyltransferase [Bacteroidales bacterium]